MAYFENRAVCFGTGTLIGILIAGWLLTILLAIFLIIWCRRFVSPVNYDMCYVCNVSEVTSSNPAVSLSLVDCHLSNGPVIFCYIGVS